MFLIEGMSTVEISKKLFRDHPTIKKAVEDIIENSKRKGFKNWFPWDERKIKWKYSEMATF